MKARNLTYWIATALIAFDATIAGTTYLFHAPFLMKAFAHMGYPSYFINILGVAQLLGASVLLLPGNVTFKEWAYAGFGFIYLGGAISHWVSGDGAESLEPVVLLMVLAASYLTRTARV
jgi:hypothetical protein